MRNAWRWIVLAVAVTITGMVGLSVLAVPARVTRMAVDISAPETRPVRVHPIPPDRQIPKSGPKRPTAVIVTWYDNQWRAFSNRTGPYGCEVVVRPGDALNHFWPGEYLSESCHGAVYDLTGRQIAGPRRTLYEYPVRYVQPGTLEIDLGRPSPIPLPQASA